MDNDNVIIVMPEPDEFILPAEPFEFTVAVEQDDIFVPEAQ